MIPCIENKCLLLPTCRTKISISCPTLFEYYDMKDKLIKKQTMKRHYSVAQRRYIKLKRQLRNTFPNIVCLYKTEPLQAPYYYFNKIYNEQGKYIHD